MVLRGATLAAVIFGAATGTLNGLAWISTSPNAIGIFLTLVPFFLGLWGYPFALSKGDAPPQATSLAALYVGGLATILLLGRIVTVPAI